jgi:glycine/D-amino acid oxidase-like deaminating enzyme
MTSTDVAIVGGGLIGLAAALNLARRGAKVTVLDQGNFGEHQSMRNWGFARQQGRSPVELPMMQLANKMWQGLSDDLGMETSWVQGGNLAVFESQADEMKYHRWLQVGSEAGIETELVPESEIRSIIPSWQRAVRGGIYAPTDGHADPATVVKAYVASCENAGVTLMPHTPVTRLEKSGDRIVGLQTERQRIHASSVVVAAGSWSRMLLSTIGVNLPQNYVHGTVSLTTEAPPMTDVTVWGPGFSFRQRRDGRFICATGGGGTVDIGLDTIKQAPLFLGAFRKNWRRFKLRPARHLPLEARALLSGKRFRTIGPPAPRVDRRQPLLALQRLQQSLNGLGDLQVTESWAGIIDSTPDGLPVLDQDPTVGGLTIATGFSGHGYGLVPAAGHLVADLVQGGPTICDVSAMRLSRFTGGQYTSPNAIL